MKRLSLVLLVVGLTAAPLYAQAQSNTADISGLVKDQTGGVLPGVTISVTNTETGFTRSAVTGDEGAYRILVIPPGEYEVRAELASFTT